MGNQGVAVEIAVSPSIPDIIMIDTFCVFCILDNAFSNAKVHGQKGGCIRLEITCHAPNQLQLSLLNLPGPKHSINMELQRQHGSGYLMSTKNLIVAAAAEVGNSSSTYRGMNEINMLVQSSDAGSHSIEFA